MKIRLPNTIQLSEKDREALAFRIDGLHPNYDAPTGRKASHAEIVALFELWLDNELSESRMTYEEACDQES